MSGDFIEGAVNNPLPAILFVVAVLVFALGHPDFVLRLFGVHSDRLLARRCRAWLDDLGYSSEPLVGVGSGHETFTFHLSAVLHGERLEDGTRPRIFEYSVFKEKKGPFRDYLSVGHNQILPDPVRTALGRLPQLERDRAAALVNLELAQCGIEYLGIYHSLEEKKPVTLLVRISTSKNVTEEDFRAAVRLLRRASVVLVQTAALAAGASQDFRQGGGPPPPALPPAPDGDAEGVERPFA